MRHDTVEGVVLLNRALLAEAEEARAQATFVQCHSLIVQVGWLLSSTANPPWRFSARAASGESYARYEEIAAAAWARGLSRWRQQSRVSLLRTKPPKRRMTKGNPPGTILEAIDVRLASWTR